MISLVVDAFTWQHLMPFIDHLAWAPRSTKGFELPLEAKQIIDPQGHPSLLWKFTPSFSRKPSAQTWAPRILLWKLTLQGFFFF